MEKARIVIQNCNQAILDAPLKISNKLYQELGVKHPNAWHIKLAGNTKWDGVVHYMNEYGKFKIGLLPTVYNRLIELGYQVTIEDNRPPLDIRPRVPKYIGNLEARPEQAQVIHAIVNSKIGGAPFYIGVQNLAVNFGKSLVMAGVHLAFRGKLRTLLLTNDSDWLEQSRKEFPELLPRENITFIQGSKVKDWGQFSVGMVQSISRNIRTYQNELSKIDMVLVDECDLSDNKTYKTVLEHLWNTRVRLGLSGTVYLSKYKKDVVHNMNIRAFLGDELTTVKLKEMIDKGYSSDVLVKMVPVEYNQEKFKFKDYKTEYDAIITDNKKAHRISYKRAMFNYEKGRLPMIVVTKYIRHCELLYAYYKKKLEGTAITIAYVHHDTADRKAIIQRFREGKIDILISTTIIARGKNFPLLKYLQNTASMDSNEKTIQFLGRLVRTHKSKGRTYLDDICFNGKYLSKHAKHRKNFYVKEKLTILKL